MRSPRLWIAYDFTSPSECLDMLGTVLAAHPEQEIIHEIGRPTILNAALAGVPIVREFRDRLDNGQLLVADFKGYDVPYVAEGTFYYAAGADLVTVMATAPDEAIIEAVDGARAEGKLVAFDLMSHQDDRAKARRARKLAGMGAELVSCHVGWSEQAQGKTADALLAQVHHALHGTQAKIIAMGGLKPGNVVELRQYATDDSLFAIVAGSSITRSADPAGVVSAFLDEIEHLTGQLV
ncbi:3-hexulose-6-phosphate synthase [Lentzea roselyniae]|uniref:3-hexulose-6-phosphate synthase n=1 Tax=Lentzea roselyniae TaxID=531940 RepID=A0ABP7CGS1_9PSEU